MVSCFALGCEGVWWAGVLLSTGCAAGFSTCFTAGAGLVAGAVLVVAVGFAGAAVVGFAVVTGLTATGAATAESVFTVFFSTLAGFSGEH